ncbi:carbon-nitrogen hydrolase [Acidobacteria bacterium Mor1]|nr:carbon-nitrogen hydrolase [Acidobacteria bacterium Mor1]
MKIALIQQHATDDKQQNLERGLAAARKAAADGAKLICFAELAFEPFYPQKVAGPGARDLAEPIPGPITEAFQNLSRELGVVSVLNLYERDGDKAYDTSPVIDADGTLLGRTRMVHITEYEGFHEQGYYDPGDTGAPVFDTAVGKVGIAICYDRHFPEYMRALALNGAELVIIPQAGSVGEWPAGLYEAELQVAAFQNGYYAALCNRVGKEPVLDFAGESFVCAPDGRIVAQAPQGDDHVLLAEVDLGTVAQSHARTLFRRHRRPELYSDWVAKP